MIGPVIVNEGKVVRPSQLIASLGGLSVNASEGYGGLPLPERYTCLSGRY